MTANLSPSIEHLAVPMKDLRLLEGNPNQGDVDAIATSLETFGQYKPIVWHRQNRKRIVITGNHTYRAAEKLGWDEIAAVEYRGSRETAMAVALADNRTAELGSTDNQALLDLIEQVNDEALRSATGYSSEYVENLTKLLQPKAIITNPDDVPQPLGAAITKTGDVWLLGRHRLMCGDSTDFETVEQLMDGELADIVFTDPPYGVDYEGGTTKREKLEGDGDTDLYAPCAMVAHRYSKENAPLYMWHAGGKSFAAAQAVEDAGWTIRAQIIWNKNQAQFGALGAQYKHKHEPCFYCVKKGTAVNWNGPTNEVTVWDIDRAPKNDLHPTQKPVALAERAIENHDTDTVLDLFGGSGSTLIAAETTGRRAFVMELSPHYSDVICLRYQLATGTKPVRASTGKPVDFDKGAA